MEQVAAAPARALTPMSRRTRHAHRLRLQLAADPPLQAPPLPHPPETRATIINDNGNNNGNGVQQSQRRMDLEQEVAELKQQLSNEQTVHHILERALQLPTSSSTTTNSSSSARSVLVNIPAKAKQLLAEIVLVEEEIARLESQIHTMKGSLTVSQQQRASAAMASNTYTNPPTSVHTSNFGGNGNLPSIYTDHGSANGNVSNGASITGNGTAAHSAPASTRRGNINVNGGATTGNNTTAHSTPASTRHGNNNVNGGAPAPTRQPVSDQVTPEIKSMFFISQAMNAEYLQRHLATADDKPAKSPREQARRSSGAAAAVSPKLNTNIFGLPPRNSLEKKSDRAPERDEQSKAQLPNKLSERIVKCLTVIFIRLLRSSRAAEMEKSGNLARSGNLQGSFRIDAVLNVAAAKEKDRRGQQDHYGIFGVPDSVVRDIGPYKNLVRFTSGAFDLRGFSSSPLLTKLREMLEALQQVDLRFLTHQQKLAFWLNIYNTCIMHGILQHGLPSNSEKLLTLKNKATINVSGQKLNALVIENFILRQPSSVKEEFWKCDVDVEEQQVRGLYGLNSSEPNILFAMCCGIRSSPALRIYKADRVIMELEKAKLDYLQASLVVTSTRRLMIPDLIHSNMHDFAKDMGSLLLWICDQLPTSWSLRKSMVDCLRGHQGHLKVDDTMEVMPCDYEFQYLLPM